MNDNNQIQKGTHVELFQPVVRGEDGKYVAVLSANSTDRDNDVVSEKCLRKMAKDEDYTVILMDHKNLVENQVGEWVNKHVVKKNDVYALVAEPKFYLSNPKAQYIQNMLDEGAKMGISIGAIINDYTKMEDDEGNLVGYQYDDVELLEASFVAIPSNRHGRAMAIAKMLKNKKGSEEKTMTEEPLKYSQKDFDSELAKANDGFEKKLGESTKALEDYKAEAEKSLEAEKEKTKAGEDELAKNAEKIKELEDLKVFKAKHEESLKTKATANDADKKAQDEKNYKEEKKLPKYEFGSDE